MKAINFLKQKCRFYIRRVRRWRAGKTIKFLYVSTQRCNLNDEKFSHWGCCCQCVHRLNVTKHCWHSNYSDSCNCNEAIGFYVCDLFHAMGETDRVNLCGEHGMCECFQQRPAFA